MPQIVKMEVTPSLGMNTALNPSNLPQGAQRQAYDACMREVDTIGKRPGSVPVMATPLAEDISYLTTYVSPNSVSVGAAPTLNASPNPSSTLPGGTYYVRYTYVTDKGETEASGESVQGIVNGTNLLISIPSFPAGVNKARVYIGTATNTEKLEGETLTNSFVKNTPLTGTQRYPVVNTIEKTEELLAVSDNTLYMYYGGNLNAVTMTNPLYTPDVHSEAFTNAANVSTLLLTDGADLKQFNSTAVVNVTPAANDPSPAPPNDLAAINLVGPKYVWSHTGHVFLSAGSDLIWYSKRYEFNYFPSTQFFKFVRNNDYITGPGITFSNLCLIPMRRGWGILMGEVFDDGTVSNGFKGNQFLNTLNGNISPRGFTRITYPNGVQTIAYLSDDGVHEIYDTGFEGEGVRQYSTRSLMKDKIDFAKFGFSNEDKAAAVAHFDPVSNWLYIAINSSTLGNYIFIYDTRNQQWYVWRMPWAVKAFAKWQDTNYFGGVQKLLQAFDDELYTDWNESTKTTGTAVDFDCYSGLLSFEFSGDSSYLDYYLAECQLWDVPSSLDVWIVYGTGKVEFNPAQYNEIFVWGRTEYGHGQYANLSFTDYVNNAQRLVIHRKGKFFQRRLRNNKDEPVILLREKYTGRTSGRS